MKFLALVIGLLLASRLLYVYLRGLRRRIGKEQKAVSAQLHLGTRKISIIEEDNKYLYPPLPQTYVDDRDLEVYKRIRKLQKKRKQPVFALAASAASGATAIAYAQVPKHPPTDI